MKDKNSHNVKISVRTPAQFFASGLGSGCSPVAPGTFGTLVAIPFWVLMTPLSPMFYSIIVVILFVLGCWISDVASKELGVHDHGGIVIDEFVGYFITMFMVPLSVLNIIIGFIVFRVLDIIKPWPIKWVDKQVKGGVGIMMDDVLAGILSLFTMQGILWIYAKFFTI